ncbi:lysophosphatidyl acyltransferase 5 [Actinidia rufa]|uniref:1-acylglycerol-3-phosphate O-acyltransferase n=1 Tax=Actinidia rufa TaxID=165716 RepID=A0A7J0F9G7_9ERIC|nr:lysophosphatidyl acyltransferase 5 [Actinidia rufa]
MEANARSQMEGCDRPRNRALTPLGNIHYSRKITSFFFGAWLALWPFLFEKINKTKVVFSGDRVPARERVVLIANHKTEVDWMYLWDLALRKGQIGYIKYILKSSLMKLPVFGWSFLIMEFIPVERRWEAQIFAEHKCIKSQKYAAENGLPILKNVLLPKTKGLFACLEELKESLDAVYDITIAYKHRCPSFMDNAFGVDPNEVHIHIHRIPITDIPTTEDETGSWLINRFSLKDQLLTDFNLRGHFPHEGTEGDLSTMKCLMNFLGVIVLTSIGTFLTFFSSVWFKMYVSLVCAYLASATYFHIRPSPLFAV